MHKKIVALILTVTMCASLMACGQTAETDATVSDDAVIEEDSASENEPEETEIIEEAPEETAEEEEEEPVSLMGYNMIANGDFTEGIDNWISYLNQGQADFACVDEQLVVTITNNGPLMHSVQVAVGDFALYEGCVYEVSFDACSSIERDVEYRIQINGGDYHYYNQEILHLTPEMQHFDITFTMEEADDPAPRLCFNMGNIDAEGLAEHTITYDNFEMYCIDESGRVGGSSGVDTPDVQVNQIGYLPNAAKIATLTGETLDTTFDVVDAASGEVVYSGNVSAPMQNSNTERTEAQADFSDLTTPGVYKIVTENCGESYEFTIGNDVYEQAMNAAVKMFYYQRCGETLTEDCADEFAHAACHSQEAVYYDDQNRTADVSGGWHDAGDYGRYIVPGAKAVADLLLAYELYPEAFSDSVGIPESGNGTPDVLDEVRYELEWFFKMQDADGGVHHKVTCANFPGTVMPEEETETLYILPVSTTATGTYAAAMAMAARVYEDVDPAFAEKCLSAAELAYDYLENANGGNGYRNPSDVVTGEYGDSNDADERLWAAAELFRTTGDSKYETAVAQILNGDYPGGLGWADVGYYGTYAYMASDYTDNSAYTKAKTCMETGVMAVIANAAADTYQSSISGNYPWGSNMTIANNGMLLLLYEEVAGENNQDVAFAQLDYLLGNNGNSYCFLTGFGTLSPEGTHHRPSQCLGTTLPGMLVGGPNNGLEDPYAAAVLVNTPPALCYVDNEQSYSCNEITIYWNSPLVFLFAASK
ncbi:MAG: glycoside hydrolase family 9 protein [Lachnospiraceae bacterium]